MKYRREIDGLRALAVLPVMLFHAGFGAFGGGFVGVDVFFVISGYLITTIILAELEQGTFSIVNFYERRARRILPALFFVMLVCIPLAWWWLLPGDLKNFSQSLMAVTLFASNVFFWRQSGYFDAAAELSPLLHTWSLAVEEQYYVLFPLFLVLFWKFGRRSILISLAVVFVGSLALAQWAANAKPDAGFYLLPTRGWELLIGAFAAFYLSRADAKPFGQKWSEFAGWSGVALILFAVFAYSKTTPFPGFYALVPTLGTVLVILFATQQTTVGRFVGNKVFVGVGLISYSAYLWHQPLFAFARQRSLLEPSETVFLLLIGLSLLLAYFSWRWIESPFRSRSMVNRRQVFLFAFIGGVSFIALGMFGSITDGKFVQRKDSSFVEQLDERVRVNHGLSMACEGDYHDLPNCRTAENPEVLLWGDSYAMHLLQGLVASKPDLGIVQKTVSTCGPFLGIAPINSRYVRSWAEKCMAINDKVLDYLKGATSVKYVVLGSPFDQYLDDEAHVLTREGNVVKGQDVAAESMRATIRKIKDLGKVPVIVSPTPQNGQDIGGCLKKAAFFRSDSAVCNFSQSESLTRQANVWSFLAEMKDHVSVIDLADHVCTDGTCQASMDGVFVYRDRGHLSHEGSALLGQKMNLYQLLVASGRTGK